MNYIGDSINVVFCSSDFFSEVCAVSIISLFENNKPLNEINVYIIDDHISEKNQERLLLLAKRYNRSIIFIQLPNPSEFYGDIRFTIGSLGHTYARMILGDIIPENVERIISLDSDTMILGPINELWNIDMKDKPIAGVDDCMGKIALVKTQHLKADATHCNAGMLLIDLAIWRTEKWSEKFLHYMKDLFDKGLSLGGYEEEVINRILGKRMMILHPKYNLMTLEQVFSYDEVLLFREPLHYYSEKEINEAKTHPVITHTTNFFYIRKRIFEEDSDHPMRREYEKYRHISPWESEPPMMFNPSIKQKFMKNIWHYMPKKIAIYVAKFVRNEVRPLLDKKRDDE